MKPEISIIIPFYNTKEELFKNCINSVLKQTFTNFELLIINDGSEESYFKELTKVKQLDDRIRVINKENGGVSTARNRGLEEASGEYISFIDADDIVSPYFLQQAYEIIKETDIDFVLGSMKVVDYKKINEIVFEKTNTNNYFICQKENFYEIIPSLLASKKMIRFSNGGFINRGPCSRLLKASIAKECIFPKGIALGEDVIWNQLVLEKCKNLVIAENIWYYYIMNEESASHKYSSNVITTIQDFGNKLYEVIDNSNDKIYAAYCTKLIEDIRGKVCRSYLTRSENKDSFCRKWSLFNQLKKQMPWSYINKRFFRLCNNREKLLYLLLKTNLFFPLAYVWDRIKE